MLSCLSLKIFDLSYTAHSFLTNRQNMYFHVIHKMNFLNKINAIITFPLDYQTILVRIFFYASFQEF